MELKGQIDDIIYQNETNSYTVCTLNIDDELTTCVGYLPFINIGDTIKIQGNYVTHQDYGMQFKIDMFEKVMPEDSKSLEKYLAGGAIKGIGPATAKKIIDKFDNETIHILKFEPEKLASVSGITKEKALEIGEEFNTKWELWQIVSFLEKFSIGVNQAQKVFNALGRNAIDIIEQNPYILIDITTGVDFKIVDKMASDLGLDAKYEARIQSGIKYGLGVIGANGHCCTIKNNLIQFAKQLLGIDEEEIEDSLINLKVKGEIAIEQRDDDEWVYLFPFYKAELNIAQRLKQVINEKNIVGIENWNKKLKENEEKSKTELSKKQREAIRLVIESNLCIITGGPGTGKTTIIKNIIELFEQEGLEVVLCAPTGRAAKRLTETTNREAKTLHRLLEIGKIEEADKFTNLDYEVAPIDADLLVVDELSMVDVFLMNYLLKGISSKTKIVLVGDADQLPSVGPGNILSDLIQSKEVPVIILDKIFRQAAKSKIITNAHKINHGETFLDENSPNGTDTFEEIFKISSKVSVPFGEFSSDFMYINESNPVLILQNIIDLFDGELRKFDFYQNLQILTPTKKGALGTKELNKELQEVFNPKSDRKKEKIYGQVIFREQDKIMQIKNNYDIFWEKIEDTYESGTGVFNGDLGVIEKIDEEDKQIKIKFDDNKIVWYDYNQLEEIEHAYATTIHKSQGSEFEAVVIAITNSTPLLLTRNLLYTGVTRAKKLLVLIGNKNIIDFMVQNNDIKKRNTGLKFKLMMLK